MKIGLLAYHSACNFGASLQLLSTFCYLKNNGHDPIIINWVPEDLELFYKNISKDVQYKMQQSFRKTIWKETELCRTSVDVAQTIERENIKAVIVGSDAVAQNHTKRERFTFPTRTLFSISKATSDRIYPNPFWGEFEEHLKVKVPIAFLSASSQDSVYKYYSKETKQRMAKSIMSFSHVSVRDTWTRDMFAYITDNNVVPVVTPDPVFAFGYNASNLIPEKALLLKKFNLPEDYYLMSFEPRRGITQDWINEFIEKSRKLGIECAGMPFSMAPTIGNFPISIEYPLTPIEWFALIKYSRGYIGNNMHPIVVSLHNSVPFFSFDNYGITKFKGFLTSDKSSKIKHILSVSEFDYLRVSCLNKRFSLPKVDDVLFKLNSFDYEKASDFAVKYHQLYLKNMESIINSFVYD